MFFKFFFITLEISIQLSYNVKNTLPGNFARYGSISESFLLVTHGFCKLIKVSMVFFLGGGLLKYFKKTFRQNSLCSGNIHERYTHLNQLLSETEKSPTSRILQHPHLRIRTIIYFHLPS